MYSAPCVGNIQAAIEHIYPLVNEFRKERTAEDIKTMQATKRARQGLKRKCLSPQEDVDCIDLEDEEELLDEEEDDVEMLDSD